MKLTRFRYNKLACAVAVIGTVSVLTAGDLNPPSGPVEPTGRFGPRTEISDTKTPGDVNSLFKITEPGSYYLAGNITGVTGKNGIAIDADDVTLDLNGFALIGVGGSPSGSNSGVSIAAGVENLAVRNGTIRDWGNFGVGPQDNANPSPIPANGLFENLRVSGNGAHGLLLGESSRVINCGAINNAADGFEIGPGSTVINCTARGNRHNGFAAGESCVFVNCIALDNQGFSFSDGFDVGPGSVLKGCSAQGNSGNGIIARTQVTIAGCTSISNALFGINAPDCLIRGNTIRNNTGGDCSALGSTLIHNHGCADTGN